MSGEWVEVCSVAAIDPAEFLSQLDDPAMAGAWEAPDGIRLYWAAGAWDSNRLARLEEQLTEHGHDAAVLSMQHVPGQDWNAIWARSVRPIRIGRRIIVRPSWEPVVLQPGDVELVLDPKQAYGSGHHAITQLLIEWLEELIAGGERVLDLGTGSGMLTMVVLRLGARSATGIDHDPIAIDCAHGYAKENGFGPELMFRVAGLGDLDGFPYDAVFANLDRQTLLAHARCLPWVLSPRGRLLLYGILAEDRPEIEDAFKGHGLTAVEGRERDGWLALQLSSDQGKAT